MNKLLMLGALSLLATCTTLTACTEADDEGSNPEADADSDADTDADTDTDADSDSDADSDADSDTDADGDYWSDGYCGDMIDTSGGGGAALPSSDDCKDITLVGCCNEAGQAIWCESGTLWCFDCEKYYGGDSPCGWAGDAGYYGCGGMGEDPGGSNPINCP